MEYLPDVLSNAKIVNAIPSALNKSLAAGDLDVALLSSVVLLNNPDYQYIPNIGIISDGLVRSVGLFTRKEIHQIETVALDESSLASIMMARILFTEYWNQAPRFIGFPPSCEDGLSNADAVVTIGDKTFTMYDGTARRNDLGQIWKEFTGLPFVYALWVTRPGIDPLELEPAFSEAKRRGLQNVDRIAEKCQTQFPSLHSGFFMEYLTQNLSYDLGEREIKGMELFFSKARDYTK